MAPPVARPTPLGLALTWAPRAFDNQTVIRIGGGVFYGFNADRDSMADVDEFGDLVTEALTELLATVPR